MADRISDDRLRGILSQCTRGPWQRSGVRAHEPKHKGHLVGPDGDGVVSVPYWDKAHAECMANADLIALSPALAAEVLQLREALREIADTEPPSETWDGPLGIRALRNRARAALSTPPAHVVDAVKREGR